MAYLLLLQFLGTIDHVPNKSRVWDEWNRNATLQNWTHITISAPKQYTLFLWMKQLKLWSRLFLEGQCKTLTAYSLRTIVFRVRKQWDYCCQVLISMVKTIVHSQRIHLMNFLKSNRRVEDVLNRLIGINYEYLDDGCKIIVISGMDTVKGNDF